MISKLLLTLSVIAIAWFVIRYRSRSGQLPSTTLPPRLSARQDKSNGSSLRLAAYGLILFMVLASGLFIFLQWRDEYRIVTVRVINSQTGETVTYMARRGDVEDRHFQTLDGRVVSVAEIERIEMGGDSR
jgi:hypothetical protein